MLVLSRKPGEKLVFLIHDQEVVVEVLSSRCSRVRVGVSASHSVKILRHELWDDFEAQPSADHSAKSVTTTRSSP